MTTSPSSADVRVKVWGPFGLFTQPTLNVERVTYPCMTPSAARGALEAIYWKPEFRYRIQRIDVLNPVRTLNVLRNELGGKQQLSVTPQPVQVSEDRQQRLSVMLKDVAYVIHANIVPTFPQLDARSERAKHIASLQQRLKNGRCKQQPFLGTRECMAYFKPASTEDAPNQDVNEHIGLMLFDLAYVPSNERADFQFKRKPALHEPLAWVSGYAQPIFFEARIDRGVLAVPQAMYDSISKLETVH